MFSARLLDHFEHPRNAGDTAVGNVRPCACRGPRQWRNDRRCPHHLPGPDREASGRVPVAVWREAMTAAFGDTAWLRLDRGLFDRLYAFRAERGLVSWDAAIEELLAWTR